MVTNKKEDDYGKKIGKKLDDRTTVVVRKPQRSEPIEKPPDRL
jgi:hypothetical protein